MKTNCPNCGAPYDVNLNKCPYCGTTYLDMSSIDMDADTPFFLKIKTGGIIVTQKVKGIKKCEISVTSNYTDMVNNGYVLQRYVTSSSVITHMEFEAISTTYDDMPEDKVTLRVDTAKNK